MNFKTAQTQNQDSVFFQGSNHRLNARSAYHQRYYYPELEQLSYFYAVCKS
jgi:hypothetical protein